jgi:hypothetical protein
MGMTKKLQTIVDRANTGGTLNPVDRQALDTAIQSGQVTVVLATGARAIGIGRSADGSLLTTGNNNHINNIVLNIPDTEAGLKLLQQLNLATTSSSPPFAKAPAPQFPEVSKFDLTQLVEQCIDELLGKRGLIGLAVPCGEKAFLKNFCDRLKHELGRSNIQIRQPLSLNPQVISVSKAVEAIKQYKKLLQIGDVICPIRVGVCDISSSIPQDFWQQIQADFQADIKHRLIIVMVGTADCIFPSDALRLHPPQFKKAHAFKWIRDITQALSWEMVMEEWTEKMVDRCLDDGQLLDVGLVYEHLDYTLSLIQRNPSLSAADFLDQLD